MRYIVDDIGSVVTSIRENYEWADEFKDFRGNAPYYMYGHELEIAARLRNKDKGQQQKFNKYPLIALRLDTIETIGNGTVNYDLNIILLAQSTIGDNAEERYAKVFKPILYPLYENFLIALRRSGLFVWQQQGLTANHRKVDRPFWGASVAQSEQKKNIKFLFSDPLDGIELLNLKLNSTKGC